MTDHADTAEGLRCEVCGQALRRGRGGGLVHAGFGPVAACDLDADHAPVPAGGASGATPPGAS